MSYLESQLPPMLMPISVVIVEPVPVVVVLLLPLSLSWLSWHELKLLR